MMQIDEPHVFLQDPDNSVVLSINGENLVSWFFLFRSHEVTHQRVEAVCEQRLQRIK